MTALPHARPDGQTLRVLRGRRLRRPTMAPWVIVSIIAVVGFLGLGFARTSLDRAAFELAELNNAITGAEGTNRRLKLEIARLENPARIAPLAEGLGLVIPRDTQQLLVDLDSSPVVAGADAEGTNQ